MENAGLGGIFRDTSLVNVAPNGWTRMRILTDVVGELNGEFGRKSHNLVRSLPDNEGDITTT
jgi:hypothetical protein